MEKVLAIIAAAIIVAAAGIGIGLWSFGTAPQKNLPNSTSPVSTNNLNNLSNQTTNAEELPIQDVFYSGLVSRGYPQALAGIVSSDLEVLADNNTNQHYVQYFGGGGYRDLNISLTPVKNYNHTNSEQIFTLADGTVMYVTNKNIKTYSDGYNFTMNFFIPIDKMSTQMKEDLGLSDVQPVAFQSIFDVHVQYAQAIDVIPEGGIVGQVSESFGTEGTGINQVQAGQSVSEGTALNPVKISQAEVTQSGVDVTRDLGEYYQETKQFVKESSRLQDEINVNQAAEKIKSEIAAKQAARDAAQAAKASKIQAGLGAAHVALTGLEVKEIVDEADQLVKKLQDLLDCAQHPTNPLAIRAQQDDPNYNRATVDVLNRAISEVKGINAARIISTTTNSAMATGTGLVGAALIGGLSQVESKMLLDTIENDIMPDAGKGVVPCDKCKEDQTSSPNPEDSGPNYTPGPDDSGLNYTPGPAKPAPPQSEICLPNTDKVRVKLNVIENLGDYLVHEKTFQANANVTNLIPVGTSGSMFKVQDYHGNATGFYHETAEYFDENCGTTILRQGDAIMNVDIRINEDNATQVEVDVGIVAENLNRSDSNPDPINCTMYTGVSDGNDESISCVFLDVNVAGGYYRDQGYYDDSDEDDHRAFKCELFMGPLDDIPP